MTHLPLWSQLHNKKAPEIKTGDDTWKLTLISKIYGEKAQADWRGATAPSEDRLEVKVPL